MDQPALSGSLPHPAIVLCLSPTGLAVARALHAAGVSVYGCDPDPLEIGQFSSALRRLPRHPGQRDSRHLLTAVLDFCRRCEAGPVIFTAGDEQIEWLAEHYSRLEPYARIQHCARPEVASRFIDKRSFYRWMHSLEVDLPATLFPSSEAEVEAAARDLRYPVILKPARGHAWRRHLRGAKVVEASNPEVLLQSYRGLAHFDPAVVIQEVVPGPEKEIVVAACAIASDDRPLAVFTARKWRQYPYYFGSACYCVSEWVPEVADLSLELLSRLRFRGACGTEFKRDPRTGRWKLIEVNPRPTLWYDLARVSGVNPVEAVYRDLVGLPPAPRPRQRDGPTWRYLARDWVACMHAWLRSDPDAPGLRAALRWPESEAIAWSRDPGACLVYPFYVVAHAARHLVGQ